MGALAPVLMVGQVLMAGASTFMQMRQANQQAAAAQSAAQQQAAWAYSEAQRQQIALHEQAQQEKAEAIRKANKELGSIYAAASEMGASNSSLLRIVSEVGGAEGREVSTIEANKRAKIEKTEADKKAASQGYMNTVTEAYNTAATKRTGAMLGFISSGLQIGADYAMSQSRLDSMKNTKE